MINSKLFDHRPISELIAIVKGDMRKQADEGLIDEGTLIKTVMYCNDKLGIPIREVKQVCLPVIEYKAKLPLNFEKLYYAAGLLATNTIIHHQKNPFDNQFDRDIIYEADLDRAKLGGVENYSVTVKRITNTTIHNYGNWISLEVAPNSFSHCHVSCPNMRKKGKHMIEINGDEILTPFRSGEIYIMYLGAMKDEMGNILFPFNPIITPYYEWSLKEKILTDAIFNSDGNYGELLKLAKQERLKAWLDAFDITTTREYGDYISEQRKKELGWYNQYFRYLQ
jgi:hypothetical protein